ncbi:unnamed protein product [Tuber aestivum]|uniref:Uncharacterized protein n=1 Tax=Tuber aestivum TaxID=59557 RepID=A0A292PL86_9PEZI|nr:unnamed protein product [Tuber aestivum]
MSSPPPEVPEEVDVVNAIAPPDKLHIRYSNETTSNRRWRHVPFDISAITPGDIGGLYAALCSTITTDLQRLQYERKLASKRASSFGISSPAPGAEARYEPLNCELRIEYCRLLDKSGKLVLPPLGKANVVVAESKEDWERAGGRSRRMDLVEWLLSAAVVGVVGATSEEGAVAWGEEVLQGLLFEEGVNWPWYSISASFVFESRLDLVLKHHAGLAASGIDPQTFFPIPPPHPAKSPSPPAVPEKDAKPAPAAAAPANASRSRKVELVRAKSKSAFTMKSLIKS